MPRPKTKRPPHRPSLLTDETKKIILSAVSQGVTIRFAAEAAGVAACTVQDWMAKGDHDAEGGKPTSMYAVFASELTRARSAGLAVLISEIRKDPDWRAKAWLAERWAREDYGRADRLDVRAETVGPAPNIIVRGWDDDDATTT